MKNSLLYSLCVLAFTADASASKPVETAIAPGKQMSVRISNSNPNYFEITGDRITRVTTTKGMLMDKRNSDAGGAFISTVQTEPFTIFLETESGQTYSLQVAPAALAGQTYLLGGAARKLHSYTSDRETAQPYEKLLITLNKAAFVGKIPPGYANVTTHDASLKTPADLQASPSAVWQGTYLKVTHWKLSNRTSFPVQLQEQDYWEPGVRSVMFTSAGKELIGGGTVTLIVVSSTSDNNG